MLLNILESIDSIMYYPILIIVMTIAGLYFSVRTGFIQIRLFKDACGLIMEKPADKAQVSSFQALMVSTASRVGTGNIIGVSSALCLGGPGAVFWMWIMCLIGAASAFAESTLAQIYKRNSNDGDCYGGPAYYIEQALHAPWLSIVFCIFLIATYGFGFNLLCSYNLQSSFEIYSFYHPFKTPLIIGLVLAALVGFVLLGGGKRIIRLTEVIVPFMGIGYVLVTLAVIIFNFQHIPAMFAAIFRNAFDFKSIFGGVAGSCMIYGIKRGLYSNEAGVGSAPNASASANVSHPVKQGLVQTVSVYIDTMLLCTATALMCLSSGVVGNKANEGAKYVQQSLSTLLHGAGPIFITVMLTLFAFTTLIGNLYYVDNALAYLNGKKMPSERFMKIFHIICALVILAGTLIPMDAAWAIADIFMGGMTLINLPACVLLSGVILKTLKDYETQKRNGLNPTFHAADIGLDLKTVDFWK